MVIAGAADVPRDEGEACAATLRTHAATAAIAWATAFLKDAPHA